MQQDKMIAPRIKGTLTNGQFAPNTTATGSATLDLLFAGLIDPLERFDAFAIHTKFELDAGSPYRAGDPVTDFAAQCAKDDLTKQLALASEAVIQLKALVALPLAGSLR